MGDVGMWVSQGNGRGTRVMGAAEWRLSAKPSYERAGRNMSAKPELWARRDGI